MRRVATQAPFRLHSCMLINEWPARLGMALGADRILIGRRLYVVVPKGAVYVMTVAALDQPFVHLVVERHIERRFCVAVALEAKRGLRSLQKRFPVPFGVDAVATDAADARLGMG